MAQISENKEVANQLKEDLVDKDTFTKTLIDRDSKNLIKSIELGGISHIDGVPYDSETLYRTDFIEVKENTQYKTTEALYGICWYDKNKQFLQHTSMPYYTPVTTVENAKYVRLRLSKYENASKCMFYEYNGTNEQYEPYDIYKFKENILRNNYSMIKDWLKDNGWLGNSDLAGLKWYVLGDSISCSGDNGYQGYVARDLRLTKVDKARMGNHMTYNKEDGDNNGRYGICYEVETFNMSDADIITIMIGTNDWGNRGKYPLGNPDGSDGWTTFYGALHRTCNYLTSHFVGKRIGFITDPMRHVSESELPSFLEYMDAIKEVCTKYSIPCLDLVREGCLNTMSKEVRELLIPDGLHPNTEGHKVLARPIKEFLKRL